MTDIRTSRNRTRGGRVRLSPVKPDGPTAPIDDLDIAAGLLATARSVVLVAHVHPDADALGSALGLGLGLARRGTAVQVSFARQPRHGQARIEADADRSRDRPARPGGLFVRRCFRAGVRFGHAGFPLPSIVFRPPSL